MDSLFTVNVIEKTPKPQTLCYTSMHQCYSEHLVSEEKQTLSEAEYGALCVRNLLKGDRGHYSPLEGPAITFNVGYFPHSVMQQIRTHRVGITFSVQSFRYTGERVLELGVLGEQYEVSKDPNLLQPLLDEANKIFYARPIKDYTDRKGKRYQVTPTDRHNDLMYYVKAAMYYRFKVNCGYSEEHARSIIPFDVRQHWNMSVNIRSLMHVLDLRAKKDAQLECQQLCDLIVPHFQEWVPEIWEWYKDTRYQKARLAP